MKIKYVMWNVGMSGLGIEGDGELKVESFLVGCCMEECMKKNGVKGFVWEKERKGFRWCKKKKGIVVESVDGNERWFFICV